MEIRLRPISDDDLAFMWKLHNDALREYVEKTWGWDDERQRGFVEEIVSTGEGRVVVVDGKDAGVWHVVEHDSDVLLSSIRLLPEFQSRGIGTRLIKDLLKTEKPVRLQVLKVNPQALRLYTRLGFEIDGETDTHFKMIRRP